MAYDEAFAQRIRELVEGEPGVTERKMFGGLAFLVHGRMAVVVSGRDLMMIRAHEETEERLLELDGIEPTVMRGRPMTGWLDLAGPITGDGAILRDVVAHAVAHARNLPPK